MPDAALLAKQFATRSLSPVEILETQLARIGVRDKDFHVFVHLDEAGARAAAAQSQLRYQHGTPLSPLDGISIAIKANIAVENMPWHAGTDALRDRVAEKDAACIRLLRQKGAVILGIVNMHEAAFGGTTDNPFFGRTENPACPGHTAGGSSGGSAAAVAAAFATLALGTDTLGSVRIPSGYCGIFGHKPQAGSLDLTGIAPLDPQFDQLGSHAKTAADCALLFTTLSGQTLAHAAPTAPLAMLDVEGQVELEPAIAQALRCAAETARLNGAAVERLRLPDVNYTSLRRMALLLVELAGEDIYRQQITATPDSFSPELKSMFAWAANQPLARRAAAQSGISQLAAALREAFAPYAAVLAPTTPQQAFAWGAPVPANQADITALASITGLSAMAIPQGSHEGRPLSVQLMAASDAALFAALTQLP